MTYCAKPAPGPSTGYDNGASTVMPWERKMMDAMSKIISLFFEPQRELQSGQQRKRNPVHNSTYLVLLSRHP